MHAWLSFAEAKFRRRMGEGEGEVYYGKYGSGESLAAKANRMGGKSPSVIANPDHTSFEERGFHMKAKVALPNFSS